MFILDYDYEVLIMNISFLVDGWVCFGDLFNWYFVV